MNEEEKQEARAEISESVRNGPAHYMRWQGLFLVILAVFVFGGVVGGVLIYRAHVADTNAQDLCQKLDRFIVGIEARTLATPTLTDAQKKDAIQLYENFRNDPPVCRTSR